MGLHCTRWASPPCAFSNLNHATGSSAATATSAGQRLRTPRWPHQTPNPTRSPGPIAAAATLETEYYSRKERPSVPILSHPYPQRLLLYHHLHCKFRAANKAFCRMTESFDTFDSFWVEGEKLQLGRAHWVAKELVYCRWEAEERFCVQLYYKKCFLTREGLSQQHPPLSQ